MQKWIVEIVAGPFEGYTSIVEAETAGEAKTLARAEWDAHDMHKHSTLTVKKVDTGSMTNAIRRFL